MPRIIYKNKEGKRLPGVTTIAGAYKGDITGLMHWANKGGQEGKTLDEMYGVSTEPGTLVHLMIENFLKGQETQYSGQPKEVIDIAETSFINWLDWWGKNDIRALEIEPNLISEEMQVGGTPDLIAEVNGKQCLIDWKSGKPLKYSTTLLQLAAYDMLYCETFGYFLEGFYIVVIPKNDNIPTWTVQYREKMPETAYEQFKILRQAYENEKTLQKLL